MKKKLKVNFKSEKELTFKNGELFQRMTYLMKLSNLIYKDQPELAKVYSYMVKDIGKRNAIRIDSKVKKLICPQCNNLLFMDSNTKIDCTKVSGKFVMELQCISCEKSNKIILF
jgi:RNase P subunit RPR2